MCLAIEPLRRGRVPVRYASMTCTHVRSYPQVLYDVDHRLGHWFIVTNENGAGNFKLMTSPVHAGGSHEHWVPLVQPGPTSSSVGESDALPFSNGQDVSPGALMIEEIECFKDFVAISGRMGGYTKVYDCWEKW